MKFILCFVVLLLAAGTALADDSARTQKIAEITKAQGVYQQFDDLIQQSRITTGKFLEDAFLKALNDLGVANSPSNPKYEAAFKRFSEKATTLWSADDLLAIWVKHYGKNLSDNELDQILAYYKSPIGKKDVAAGQAALAGLSQALAFESQARLAPHILALTNELRTIAAQEQAKKKAP